MSKEKQLEIIMIQSSFINPYTIHNDRPANKVPSITIEMFSAFFSFNTFINCGASEIAVKTLAAIPVILINVMLLDFRK